MGRKVKDPTKAVLRETYNKLTPNIFTKNIDINSNRVRTIRVYMIFDVHYGSKTCAKPVVDALIQRIKSDPYALVILGGDLAEFINVRDKRFNPDDIDASLLENTDNIIAKSIDDLYKWFQPIDDKIILSLSGNHELAIAKYSSSNPTKSLVERWNNDIAENAKKKKKKSEISTVSGVINGGYECILNLRIRSKAQEMVTLYLSHGWGGGRLYGSKANRILEMMYDFPNANVYASGHCISEDTEILTKDGWKTHDRITTDDECLTLNRQTNDLEYNKIEKIWKYDDYNEMVHINPRGTDIMVTKDHRMIYKWKQKNGEWGNWLETKASDFTNFNGQIRIPSAGPFNEGKELDVSDEFIQLCGWIISEGCFNVSGDMIRIYQSENHNKYNKEIQHILKSLGYKYSLSNKKDKGHTFSIRTSKQYTVKGNTLCYSICSVDSRKIREYLTDKQIPQRFLNMSVRQMRILLDTMIKGDGSTKTDKSSCYYTSDKVLADQVQELSIKCGFRSSIASHKGRFNSFDVNICKSTTSEFNVKQWKDKGSMNIVEYSGIAWCVTVKNGTIVVRRNGKASIVGNSHCPLMFPKLTHTVNKTTGKFDNDVKWFIRAPALKLARGGSLTQYESQGGYHSSPIGYTILNMRVTPGERIELEPRFKVNSYETIC